jgi:hypothetical protein
MATIEELRQVFAESVFAKASALRRLNLTSVQRARLRESVSVDIRKYTDLLAPEVSIGAKREAERIRVDLHAQSWHDQPRFDDGRTIFHFEHMVTVAAIEKMCERAGSLGRNS